MFLGLRMLYDDGLWSSRAATDRGCGSGCPSRWGTASVGRNSAAHSAALRGHAYSFDAGLSPNRVPGGTFFFTVNLIDRRSILLAANIGALRDAVRRVRARAPFSHRHLGRPPRPHAPGCATSGTLPQRDADFPGRWRGINTGFAKSLPIGEPRSPVMTHRGERAIWQPRYWEQTIRVDRDFAAHMGYTHFNPVKHGLVAHPADWPHSPVRRQRNVSRRMEGRQR
jgi:putative transposase